MKLKQNIIALVIAIGFFTLIGPVLTYAQEEEEDEISIESRRSSRRSTKKKLENIKKQQKANAAEKQRLANQKAANAAEAKRLADQKAANAAEEKRLADVNARLEKEAKELEEKEKVARESAEVAFYNKTAPGYPARLNLDAIGSQGVGHTPVTSPSFVQSGDKKSYIVPQVGQFFGRDKSEFWVEIEDKGKTYSSDKLHFDWQKRDQYPQDITIAGLKFQLAIWFDIDTINIDLLSVKP